MPSTAAVRIPTTTLLKKPATLCHTLRQRAPTPCPKPFGGCGRASFPSISVFTRKKAAGPAFVCSCGGGTADNPTSFTREVDVAAGRLLIRPITVADVGGAGVVLTRAFAGSADGQSVGNVSDYISEVMSQAPEAVMLVARLTPNDPALLPPGQSSRLVGTVSLSFSTETRETFATLQPSADSCYLSNMAVDSKLRRQGIATKMLETCEKYMEAKGIAKSIQLHVRLGDEAATELYSRFGYETIQKDSFMVKLRGITPRALLRKLIR